VKFLAKSASGPPVAWACAASSVLDDAIGPKVPPVRYFFNASVKSRLQRARYAANSCHDPPEIPLPVGGIISNTDDFVRDLAFASNLARSPGPQGSFRPGHQGCDFSPDSDLQVARRKGVSVCFLDGLVRHLPANAEGLGHHLSMSRTGCRCDNAATEPFSGH